MVATMMVETRQLPPPTTMPDLVAGVKEALRRAVLTLIAVPDPDKKFLRVAGPRWEVVRDSAEAYGWTPERVRFAPTPHDVEVYLEVLGWLTWYERRHDATASARIWSRFSSRGLQGQNTGSSRGDLPYQSAHLGVGSMTSAL